MNDLRAEFTKHATSGYLGDPQGADAYGYLRASSERQVEEGSSFPRQIESVHKAAKRDKLRVPFDLIYFDDGFTGFEFEHRPALLKLRHEVKSKPRAQHLVIEDIDRLSRNADWQQGYLLEELSRHYVQVHFFINPGSQLERYVRGYIAQEGMKKDIERMRMGNLYKAMDGKVTAKRPRYGYIKTDPKRSFYILHPEESKIMRSVYDKIIHDGWTLHQLSKWLNDAGIPTRFKTGFWTASTLYQLVKSPVYKGDFFANRNYQIKTGEFHESGKPKKTSKFRPESEWIRVEVPAIVTPEEWQAAQEALAHNAKRSSRNFRKRAWLLAGLIKCQTCQSFTFSAVVGNTKRNPRRYYGCASRRSQKARMLKTACYTPYVNADELERRVWEEIESVIYDPSLIIRRLEQREIEEHTLSYQEQLAFIDKQLADIAKEREKFEVAFQRDIYTLDEFAEKMGDIRGKLKVLEISRAKLETKLAETHSIEDQKRVVLAALAKIKAEVDRASKDGQQPQEIPFDLKRKILALIVDVIWVDSEKRVFTIEGEIKGTFALDNEDKGVSLPPASSDSGAGVAFSSSRKWQQCDWCPWR
jgi:site-specific DNA recombinase